MPTLKAAKYAEEHVAAAVNGRFGEALAECLSIKDAHCKHLFSSCVSPPTATENLIKRKLNHCHPWGTIAAAHFSVVHTLFSGQDSPDYLAIFDAQKTVASVYIDWLRNDDTAWTLPVLYTVCRDLRHFATCADEALVRNGEKACKLEVAIRSIRSAFGVCCGDRSSAGETKKVGVLFMASLLFKIYFKLNTLTICKTVINGVEKAGLLDGFRIPIAHRVTYRYYMGVLCFLQEEYDKAEEHLDFAFKHCHRNNHRNRDLIMNYLIPLRLLKGKRPIPALLSKFARLSELYQTFITAVKLGNVEMFDRHMTQVEKRLMQRGTYLVVERCRDICLRNFVKLIQRLKSGTHQIPLIAFQRIAYEVDECPEDADAKLEEIECLLANLIAQDRVRGYIHHQAKMLVLSKLEAFPAQTAIKG